MGHGEADEQPLVDLELLAHIEARDIEHNEREADLDIDGFRMRCGDDESFAAEMAQWNEPVEGYDPRARQLIPVIREVA